MAVKIRLHRMGAKKNPFYRIVAIDSRKSRDGEYIEQIGYYNPVKQPAEVRQRSCREMVESRCPTHRYGEVIIHQRRYSCG